MTAAFFDQDSLYQQACIHFGCEPRSVSMFQKPDKQRAQKRDRIAKTLDRFRKVMSSQNPPQTKQQAVEAVAPFLSLLLSLFFRQLAVEIIEWLWDKMQETNS